MFRRLTVGTALMTGCLVLAWSLPADAQRRGGQNGGGQGRTQSGHPVTGKAVPRTGSSGGSGQQGRPSSGSWSGESGRRPGSGYSGSRYARPYTRAYFGAGWYGGPGWYSYGHPAFWGLGWNWGWGLGWWGWPGYYSPYPYRGGWGYPTASVRIQVEPKTAEVYVDGHLAGTVDDFDGIFQRLDVDPGGHEITIYKEGFRPFRERLYLTAYRGVTIKSVLEPLAPGEANEPRPLPSAFPTYQNLPDREPPQGWAPGALPPPTREPEAIQEPLTGREAVPSGFGQITIRVQPADAEVVIDDEPWRGPEGAERLTVHLRPGPHRVEIRKEGFDPFVTTVEIKKGETAVLNVSLGRLSGV